MGIQQMGVQTHTHLQPAAQCSPPPSAARRPDEDTSVRHLLLTTTTTHLSTQLTSPPQHATSK